MARLDDQLLTLFHSLAAGDQATLLAFADFLRSRAGTGAAPVVSRAPAPVPEPEAIPRPEQESVVKAIKRLSRTYPMLDKSKMLNETSALMTQHVIQGRDVMEVIDELEAVFRRFYAELKAGQDH